MRVFLVVGLSTLKVKGGINYEKSTNNHVRRSSLQTSQLR